MVDPISEVIVIIVGILFFLTVILGLDSWQRKTYASINEKIAQDPSYLADPQKRDLCEKLLQQSRPLGIRSLMEMRKLKKNLDLSEKV